MTKKRILMILHDFPPFGVGGTIRNIKFVKYLPRFGFRPVVLTTKNQATTPIDRNMLSEIPKSVKIYRTFSLEHKLFFAPFFLFGINYKLVFVPDFNMGWVPFALRRAEKLIKKENIDIIYSSAPPFSSHIIGFLLKRRLKKIKLVLDFRDSWTENVFINYPTRFHKKLEERLEHDILRYADYIIVVSDGIKKEFLKKYKDIPPRNITVIPNGFDPEDFARKKLKKSKKKSINFIGSLYGKRSSESFLKAVKKLHACNNKAFDGWQINLIGNISINEKNFIKKINLPFLKATGFVSHKEAIDYMTNTDILLFLIGEEEKGNKGITTGKIFEYMATGRPILAVAPKNVNAAKILREYGAFVIDPKKTNYIARELSHLMNNYKRFRVKKNVLKKYNRVYQTRKLSGLITKLL